jgi:4-aminobutyrate aminotransferase-like enzyme
MEADLVRAIDDLREKGHGFAGMIVDTIFSSDGILSDPVGFLTPVVDRVRREGGLFLADEVQPGFARTGEHFWGYQRHGIRPDIVTMGKPMGNGYPIAAMAARSDLLTEFGARSRYFNTFGGSQVACAAGSAVIDVIEREGLQHNAREVGAYVRHGLEQVFANAGLPVLTRGAGLFIGVELPGPGSGPPLTAAHIVNRLRDRGVLIGLAGRDGNILKIRPPLVFSRDHADRLVEAMAGAIEIGGSRQ